MTMPNGGAPKLDIEVVQTVPPFKVTDPMEIRKVSAAAGTLPIQPGIFRGCLNIVLYYNKAMEDDSGWVVAGWIKESLGKVLMEQPMLSGRLRRLEDGGGGLEIVSNDSGARLVEAKITTTMQQFLHLKEREKLEAELAFWKELDEQ